ncbi:hypothetical protein TWF481_003268 [Arthrobotrys musiformis]|uniref:Uncharacterized protein n=1 Tax=Arthrobotrys musiformis TaxID=47236 RepID=A0AAV9VQZ0_9PEZI
MAVEDTMFVQTVEAGWIPEFDPLPPSSYAKELVQNQTVQDDEPPAEDLKTVTEWAGKFFNWVNKMIGLDPDKSKTA